MIEMKKTALSILFLVLAISASAQVFKTGYFLDNYSYGYRINPSLMPEKSFLGVAVTNVSVSPESNMGAGTLLFPTSDGKLVTGFNSAVSSDDFLGGIYGSGAIGAEASLNVLSVGIRKNRSFGNFEINARAIADAYLPYDLFAAMKIGTSPETYNLSNTSADAKVFLEVAYGKAFMIGDMVTVGVKGKALFGLGSITAGASDFDLDLGEDAIRTEGNAFINKSSKYIDYKKTEDGCLDIESFEFIPKYFGPTGYGLALDLGVTVTPIRNLSVSLGVLDLGGISWNYDMMAESHGGFEYTGDNEIDLQNPSESFEGISGKLEDLAALSEFKLRDGDVKKFESLPLTANLGVKYTFLRDIFSVGMLATHKSGRLFKSNEIRAGISATPIKWFSVAGSFGTGTFGPNMGAGVSINIATFNFHAGVDLYSGKVGTYNNLPVIPIDRFQACANAGLNLTFGERH